MAELLELKTDQIRPSPYQRRQHFDSDSLTRLAEDIRTNGLLNPVLCRPMNDHYELMHGERRWRAIRTILSWPTISAQVREATDLEARRICAAENVHREDLTSVELIESMIEWVDAYLYDTEGYAFLGDTPQQRVNYLLVKLDSDQKHGTDYFGNKFVPKVDEAFMATNQGIHWLSFLKHDLRPYMKMHRDVKRVAIEHKLNKSQAKALQQVKERAPSEFQEIKETGKVKVRSGWSTEEDDLTNASAREIADVAHHTQTMRLTETEINLALPARKSPRLIIGRAEAMSDIEDEIIDLIITSPPYNLGDESWPMGGNGRVPRDEGIGYADSLPEDLYQQWQLAVLEECYRVARPGASFFYNHKIRNRDGTMIHPLDWLRDKRNPWVLRQEIIWDRLSTHNHSATLFWPEDERIYWMTKGKPSLPNHPIGMSTVWRFYGPVVNTWHPAPFSDELPRRCMQAVGRDGITVLDPFAGSCVTLKVALEYGYDAIGIDVVGSYLKRAADENGWTRPSES